MVLADQPNKSKNIESIYPLSPMQEGMLFHSLYEPESGVYFKQFSFSVHGNVDVSAFELAWRQVVKRHPALRTFFVWNRTKGLPENKLSNFIPSKRVYLPLLLAPLLTQRLIIFIWKSLM